MKTMTYKQLRGIISEAHGDKNDRGWRKNQKPGSKKEELHEEGDDNEIIRGLEKDIRFCKAALDYPNERAAMDAKANYGKDWKKQTKVDLKNAMAKLKKLDPSNYLLKEDEDADEDLEVADGAEENDGGDDEEVKIVTFKTTDKFLVDILQSDAGINGITISTADDVQTFGPESFSDIEVNDWSEDDVEDDEEDGEDDSVDVKD